MRLGRRASREFSVASRSVVSPWPWPWSVLKDLFELLGLGLVIKSLASGWPCQFVLEIVHQADSQVTV